MCTRVRAVDGRGVARSMNPKSDPAFVRQYENVAKAHQLAFTEPILGHLQVPPEHKGPKSEAFRVMVGVLKNRLRSNVPAMSNTFQMRIREAVALEVAPLDGMYGEETLPTTIPCTDPRGLTAR